MSYTGEIKKSVKMFLSQKVFGREISASFSSVNRWQGGKTKSNKSAVKRNKEF